MNLESLNAGFLDPRHKEVKYWYHKILDRRVQITKFWAQKICKKVLQWVVKECKLAAHILYSVFHIE